MGFAMRMTLQNWSIWKKHGDFTFCWCK